MTRSLECKAAEESVRRGALARFHFQTSQFSLETDAEVSLNVVFPIECKKPYQNEARAMLVFDTVRSASHSLCRLHGKKNLNFSLSLRCPPHSRTD